jgi:hypothetical protein
MRSATTLEADLAKKVGDFARQRGLSFADALHDLLRRGLEASSPQCPRMAYAVQTHAGGFRPEIDPGQLNQLVDELEIEDSLLHSHRR